MIYDKVFFKQKIIFKVFLFSIFICFGVTLEAQSSKIHPLLVKNTRDSQILQPCLIILSERADLSAAKAIKNKTRKGQFVYETLKSFAETNQAGVRNVLNEMPDVEYRSYFIANIIAAELTQTQMEVIAEQKSVSQIVPNEPIKMDLPVIEQAEFSNRAIEWGVTHINSDDVWALGFTGQGVVVGGQDTGYEWDHPALINQYRGYNPETMNADHNYNWHDAILTAVGNPCPTPSPYPCDDNNHGTHTMGTMVGTDGGENQIGVAPGAKWMACRNMDRGDGTPETYLDCFQWFLAPTNINGNNPDPSKAPHVINNSWACPPSEGCDGAASIEPLRQAVISLKNAGVVVVVSNGNNGGICSTTVYPPATFQESFSVGATDVNEIIANFSSKGPSLYNGTHLKPEVSAPGVGVRSSHRNQGYGTSSGTSMAGPHVAGAVALIISANPGLAGQVETIEDILMETATTRLSTNDCGGIPTGTSPNNTYGHGIINALAAVQAALQFLDVSLIKFEASANKSAVQLNWAFEDISELASYKMMKSANAVDWEVIFSNENPSNSVGRLEDKNPKRGINYYRLDWIEKNTDASSSPIRAVDFLQGSLKMYPNPVYNELKLELLSGNPDEMEIQVLDMLGKIKMSTRFFAADSEIRTLQVAELPQGLYVVVVRNISNDSIIQVEKLIKN